MSISRRAFTTSPKIARVCVVVLASLCAHGVAPSASAQFQMPDPKQMAGIPRPVDDLPDGSVSVRLIRGQLSNNIAGHPVDLSFANGRKLTVNTDEAGRAQFDKLAPGSPVKAAAVVDGEKLESQEFQVPARGGIRLLLVATDKSSPAGRLAPAVSGRVSLGGESRIVLEPGDENVAVFYLLEIVNGGSAPVNPNPPFVFDMPAGAEGTTVLEGSSPLVTTSGAHVSLTGPIPPGRTLVQLVCELRTDGASLDLTQTFPADLERLAVLVKKVGDTKLGSPRIERQQDFASEGQTVIGAMGGAVSAGQPIVLSLFDLPHHSAAPRWIALTLASTIVIAGVWMAGRREDTAAIDAERKRLKARRENLLRELVRLEQDHRNGRGDETRYATRREQLVASLEHVYGSLDDPDGRAGGAPSAPEPLGTSGGTPRAAVPGTPDAAA